MICAKPDVPIDLDQTALEQHLSRSADGTRVSMFIVCRDDINGSAPTNLYGYGGFGISIFPYDSSAVLAWVEAGGWPTSRTPLTISSRLPSI